LWWVREGEEGGNGEESQEAVGEAREEAPMWAKLGF